jgi:hypothetical protein
MPEGTLKALVTNTDLAELLPADGGDFEEVLAQLAAAGIDVMRWLPSYSSREPRRS